MHARESTWSDATALGEPLEMHPIDRMQSELIVLSEDLILVFRENAILKDSGRFANCGRRLQQIRGLGLALENDALVRCLDSIDGYMRRAWECGEEARQCSHLMAARKTVGRVIAALEGRT